MQTMTSFKFIYIFLQLYLIYDVIFSIIKFSFLKTIAFLCAMVYNNTKYD